MHMPSITNCPVRPRRVKTCGTSAIPENTIGVLHRDRAKSAVMRHVAKIVESGHADWAQLGNGDVELRFATGEIFLLADTAITRIG
jgi:hypothetical protein